MKIKIIRHIKTTFNKELYPVHEDIYDAYHGFTSFLFFTKWVLDKKNMSWEEMSEYVTNYIVHNNSTLILY